MIFSDIWNTSQEDYCILFNKRILSDSCYLAIWRQNFDDFFLGHTVEDWGGLKSVYQNWFPDSQNMSILWRQYYNSEVNNTWIIAIWSNLEAIWPSWICNSSDYLARFVLVNFWIPWPQNMGLDTKLTALRQTIFKLWPFWAIWLPSWRAFWPPSWVCSLPDY